MKIKYDRSLCQGHNRCYMLAPELFDTDDEGYAILRLEAGGSNGGRLGSGRAEGASPEPETPGLSDRGTPESAAAQVPAELEEKAQLCADNCPEYAITVT